MKSAPALLTPADQDPFAIQPDRSGFFQRYWWLGLTLIVILAALVRFRVIGEAQLWWDEIHTYRWASMPLHAMLEEVGHTDFTPPFYMTLMNGWVRLFGHDKISLRIPSLLCGVISTAVIALIARRLFDERAGLAAALLLAVAPFEVAYSVEARAYALMVCLTLASMYFFLRLLAEPGCRRACIGYVLCSCLLIYTHFYGVFFVIAQNLFATLRFQSELSDRSKKITLTPRRWIALQASLGVLLLPWAWMVFDRLRTARGGGFWLKRPEIQAIIDASWVLVGGWEILLIFLFAAPFAFATLVRVNGSFRWADAIDSLKTSKWTLTIPKAAALVFLGMWIIVPHLSAFGISRVLTPIYLIRYTIGILPAMLMIGAAGLVAPGRFARVRIGAFIIVLGLCALNVRHLNHQNNDGPWAKIIGRIDAQAQSGDTVVFYSHLPGVGRELYELYGTRTNLDIRVVASDFRTLDAANTQRLVDEIGHPQRLWLVRTHHTDRDGLLFKAMSERMRVVASEAYDPGWMVKVSYLTAPDVITTTAPTLALPTTQP